jgi:hypothetical protein
LTPPINLGLPGLHVPPCPNQRKLVEQSVFARTTYNDIKTREFKTITGVVSFLIGKGAPLLLWCGR